MNKENKYSLEYAIANSIQDNKERIEKLEKKNERLKKQLQKKNKIIDEMLNYGIFGCGCPLGYELGNNKMFDCENCDDDSKKCWLKYFENKIKMRGNNEK